MRVTQLFLLFFRNSFVLFLTFWFRRFVFEWDLNKARETRSYGRSGSRDLKLDGMIWKICGKELFERMMMDRGRFYFHPSFRAGVGVVKYCWNRCRSNFSFRNKFIIVLSCGLLADNSILLKICIFNMSCWQHWWWWLWKTNCGCFYINKNKGNEELLLVILNCILQRNQNDGWSVP